MLLSKSKKISLSTKISHMKKRTVSVNDLLKNRDPEQILNLLETELKNLIQQKKELKIKFQNKFQEVEKKFQETRNQISGFQEKLQKIEKEQKDDKEWFRIEWQEATK
jgi:hypothetical protein